MKEAVYGFPCVEDPNDFIPDAECCSEAELAAHRLACETYGTPAYTPNRGCEVETDADGRLVKHVLKTSWGIGTNLVEMEPDSECAHCPHDEHRHGVGGGACLEIGCGCGRFDFAGEPA
jgi:hypothetical protein